MLIPVPEVARAVGHGGRRLSARARRRLAKRALQSAGLGALAGLAPVTAYALPQGGSVAAGTASISTNAKTVTVTQTSSKTIINWNSFGIGAGESVNFRQPGASSVALNRVLGNNPSQIFGQLTANGQIFLVNPNGVYFAPGAQVDVGGLVASTLNITDQNFLSGNYQFSGLSTAAVVNYAKIKTFSGGYVAFIGTNVDNEGKIITPGGTTALGAGGSVVLTLAGGSLASFQVTTAALNAAVKNGGAIVAPNGVVLLTAQAKNALLQTVVNNTGIIQAGSVTSTGGVVTLLGGSNGSVAVSGTISANSKSGLGGNIVVSGANVAVSGTARISATGSTGGGTIAIGGGVHGGGNIPQAVTTSVASGAVVDASATGSGAGGTVSVWSDVTNPDSVTTVSGSILARGAGAGAGGFVETSGHLLNINNATVQTVGGTGTPGTWLLDPYNVTIASNGASGTTYANTYTPTGASTILNTAIETALNAGNNVEITTGGAPGSSNGDITVNAAIAWSTATGASFTLSAYGNIFINAAITASGSAPALHLLYGQATAAGTSASYAINAPVTLPSGAIFTTQQGSAGANQITYTVITSNSALQGMSLGGNYALGTNITSGSFTSIGTTNAAFTGKFEGLGHIISGLTINQPSTHDVGLFGHASNATIRDVGLVNESVTGDFAVGGLVGALSSGTITNTYVQNVLVSGSLGEFGGLVGANDGTITDSYATGRVSAGGYFTFGGLVGGNAGTITDSYATDSVTGSSNVGGLVGSNSGAITNAYATGKLSGTNHVGGFAGSNGGSITNGYWDTATAGLTGVATGSASGVTGYTTAELAGSLRTGFSANVWADAGGQTTPYLLANEAFSNVSGAVFLANDTSATPTLYDVITNQTQLQNINTTSLTGKYVLGNDITATGNFTPVGSSGAKFNGVFNGLGNTITDLTIQESGSANVGLFGYASNATISNIGLANESVTGGQYTGGLVGNAFAGDTITNTYVQGVVSGSKDVGGLVGFNGNVLTSGNSTISDSYAAGQVVGTSSNVGGLVGANGDSSTVTNAYATASVTGTSHVGGIAGSNSGATINNVYAIGAVNGTGLDVGGLVGDNIIASLYGFWDSQTAGQATSGEGNPGASLPGETTAALAASLPAFFSSSVWANGANNTTPYLIANEVFDKVSGEVLLGTETGSTPAVYGVITDQTQLQNISTTSLSGAYVLGNHITTTGDFTPIGTSGAAFTGTLEGLNNTISNLTINEAGVNNVGLFGFANGATIRNVGLLNDSVAGNSNVGGLVGYSTNSTIANSYAQGTVSGTNQYVGGLVGWNRHSSITDNSYATGMVLGGNEVGGLVGSNSNGTITDSYATAAVSGPHNNIGGLAGASSFGAVSNAYATGNVTGAADVGGLVGDNSNGGITNAHATGNVSGLSDVGGLVGSASNGTITDIYATGNVTGTTNVGGLVGTNSSNGTISDASTMTGQVAGQTYVGGLVGKNVNSGTISGSHATEAVSGSGNVVGGLAGSNAGTITDAYATGQVEGNDNVGGLAGNNSGMITDAYATTGTVSGAEYDGGLIGYNTGTISDTYATGDVTGSSYNVGGLVGANFAPISNSYATGTVSATFGNAGGLVGLNSNTSIADVYATGAVTGFSNVGGLLGFNSNNGTITDGYWDTTTTGQADGVGSSNNSGATGLTTLQWFTQGPIATSTFSSNTWVTGYPYPVLKALPYIIITGTGTQSQGAAVPFNITSILNQNGTNAASLVNTSGIIGISPGSANSSGSYLLGGRGVAWPASYQLTYYGMDIATAAGAASSGSGSSNGSGGGSGSSSGASASSGSGSGGGSGGSSAGGSGASSGSSSGAVSNVGFGIPGGAGSPGGSANATFGYIAQFSPLYNTSTSAFSGGSNGVAYRSSNGTNFGANFGGDNGTKYGGSNGGNSWGTALGNTVSGTTSLSSVSTAPVGARTLNFSGCGPNAASASCAPYKVIDGGVKKPGDPVHLSRTQKPLSARQEAEATTRSFD